MLPPLLMIEPNMIRANQYAELFEQEGLAVDRVDSIQDALQHVQNTQSQKRTVLLSPHLLGGFGCSPRKQDYKKLVAKLFQANIAAVFLLEERAPVALNA